MRQGISVYSCAEDSSLNLDEPQVIFPGTFNPYHAGHQAIAYHADKYTGKHTILEHSIKRIEKDDTDKQRILDLISEAWYVYHRTLIITQAKMFWEKAELFPGSTFVIGSDTFDRIISPEYFKEHPDPIYARDKSLEIIREHNCNFLVYPRYKNGVLKTMAHYDDGKVDVRNFTDMSHRLIQPKFEPVDVSSTEIRNSK